MASASTRRLDDIAEQIDSLHVALDRVITDLSLRLSALERTAAELNLAVLFIMNRVQHVVASPLVGADGQRTTVATRLIDEYTRDRSAFIEEARALKAAQPLKPPPPSNGTGDHPRPALVFPGTPEPESTEDEIERVFNTAAAADDDDDEADPVTDPNPN
jgi:hypothetical protein